MPLNELLPKALKLYPKKEAVVCGQNRMDYQTLAERVWRLCQGLISLGLRRNERLAVLHENSREFLEVYFAAAHLGLILVPLNYRLSAKELAVILNDSQSRILVSQGLFDEKVRALPTSVPTLERVIWTRTERELSGHLEYEYESLLASQRPEPPPRAFHSG